MGPDVDRRADRRGDNREGADRRRDADRTSASFVRGFRVPESVDRGLTETPTESPFRFGGIVRPTQKSIFPDGCMVRSCFDALPPAGLDRDGTTPFGAFPGHKVSTVLIDSRDRDYAQYPSSSSFTVQLPEALRNVRSAILVDAQIPCSFYVFSAARGTSSMTVSVGSSTKIVTIPDGNYSSSQMATALTTALNVAFGGFAVTFDTRTQKFTLAATGTIAIDTTAAPSGKYTDWGLAYYLGFPRGKTTTGIGSVTSQGVAIMNPESFLCVHVYELDNVDQGAIYASGGRGRRCLAKVPLDGNSYSYTMFDENAVYSVLKQQPDVKRLTVSLRFHDGTLVDLNGLDWSFTVQFAHTEARG